MDRWIDEFLKPIRHRDSAPYPSPSPVLVISVHFSPISPIPSGLSLSPFISSRLNHCWGPCTVLPKMWPGALPLFPNSYSAKEAKPWEPDSLSTTVTPGKAVVLPLPSPWASGYAKRILAATTSLLEDRIFFFTQPSLPKPYFHTQLIFSLGRFISLNILSTHCCEVSYVAYS